MTQDTYHDYYDLSLMPISLGDIITWGVKSALRADVVGRNRVHVHFICDRSTGLSHYHSKSYAVEHFSFEILPAFSSHPYYSAITVHNSRAEFETMMQDILADDPVNLENYKMHQSRLRKKGSFDEVNEDFRELCSSHDDINARYALTGAYPKPKAPTDFTYDIQTMKSEFPDDTFWIAVQFRLRILDTGMPINPTPDAFIRDAPFVHWYHFFLKALTKHPQVRFILLGRLQEKPLEILRLPNVMALRTLGMGIGHEFAALLDSDVYMGSPSGFAQLAHFSDVPYEIFNCTEGGCHHYGIPYGTPRLPIAQPRQRLHYGLEDSHLLSETLQQTLKEGTVKKNRHEVLQTTRTSTTHRFFINDDQSKAEILHSLATDWMRLASLMERAKYREARKELTIIEESFAELIKEDPKYDWITRMLAHFSDPPTDPAALKAWEKQANEYAAEISAFLHPRRLVRQSGRFLYEIPVTTGLRRDGWCEKEVKFVFGPSRKGNFFMLQFARLAGASPLPLAVSINEQPPVHFTLLNEPCVIEVPILNDYLQTELRLEFGAATQLHSWDAVPLSAQIDRAGILTERLPAPTSYAPDKTDPCRGPSSGIFAGGSASCHAWLELDNPLPENEEVMIRIVGNVLKTFRRGQVFTVQINDGEEHKSMISGKYVEALIPCPGRPRHLSVVMKFAGGNTSGKFFLYRMQVWSIDILPATTKRAVFTSGPMGYAAHFFQRSRSKKAALK
jgi:hypothetical protein